MPKKLNVQPCSPMERPGPYTVESVITVDERGQMVLPKEIREKAAIRAGDKLALISWQRQGKVCCVSLIKAEEFGGIVKGLLGPVAKGIVKIGGKK